LKNGNLWRFLKQASDRYKAVVYVLGNHEYYGYSTRSGIAKMCAEFHNVHLLDPGTVMLEGVRIVGCTLWSFVPEERREIVARELNDYRYISVERTVARHKMEVEFIAREVRCAREPVVVITHHAVR